MSAACSGKGEGAPVLFEAVLGQRLCNGGLNGEQSR